MLAGRAEVASMSYRIRGAIVPSGELRELWVVDGRFTFEGVNDAETLLDDAALLPGLVDAHAHLGIASPSDSDDPRERAAASARVHLQAGVLLVREPGGPDHASTGLGPEIGLPRIITAGRFLAAPDTYFPGLAREVTDDELPDAVAEELAAGTGWAKVIGDTPLGGPGMKRTYSRDALAAAAARVHELGGRIAIHCTDAEVIQDAIEARFDTLEHGSFLRGDQIEAAAAAGVAWTPTRTIDRGIREMARDMGWPDDAVAAVERQLDGQPAVLAAAAEAGVTILAGTDAGMGPHGEIADEVQALRDAGLDPSVALGAASWTARAFLGLPGIQEDAPADLIAYRDDPLDPGTDLTSPALVMLNGQLIRDPR
jgi:imidazolonepropionase-like amidohydrolase